MVVEYLYLALRAFLGTYGVFLLGETLSGYDDGFIQTPQLSQHALGNQNDLSVCVHTPVLIGLFPPRLKADDRHIAEGRCELYPCRVIRKSRAEPKLCVVDGVSVYTLIADTSYEPDARHFSEFLPLFVGYDVPRADSASICRPGEKHSSGPKRACVIYTGKLCSRSGYCAFSWMGDVQANHAPYVECWKRTEVLYSVRPFESEIDAPIRRASGGNNGEHRGARQMDLAKKAEPWALGGVHQFNLLFGCTCCPTRSSGIKICSLNSFPQLGSLRLYLEKGILIAFLAKEKLGIGCPPLFIQNIPLETGSVSIISRGYKARKVAAKRHHWTVSVRHWKASVFFCSALLCCAKASSG